MTHLPRAYYFSSHFRRLSIAALILFLPIELLRRSRKKHIAAAVEGGFDGVLDDTNKKSVPSNLGTLS